MYKKNINFYLKEKNASKMPKNEFLKEIKKKKRLI